MKRPPTQVPLFDDAPRDGAVVTVLGGTKPADRAQASFHRLVRQIETERARLEEWRAYLARYAQRVSGELEPLYAQLRQARRAFVMQLDVAYQQPGRVRGKRQRSRLRAVIVDIIEGMLEQQADAELTALYDRYSDVPHAQLNALGMALAEDMIENMFGFRMDADHGAASMEELLDRAREQFEQNAAARQRSNPRAKKRSAAAEAKRAEAEKEVTQSVREVYRKLASALHPDRASTDLPHARKTELMQRVNRAYDDGNLLELLNIQLEIEQIDAAHLANLSAQRLAHYNRVLRDQLGELQQELRGIIQPFAGLVGCAISALRPRHVDVALDREIANMRLTLGEAEDDLELLRDDPGFLTVFLRGYQDDIPAPDAEDIALIDALFAQDMPQVQPGTAARPGGARRRKKKR